jgi:hypothetical protein
MVNKGLSKEYGEIFYILMIFGDWCELAEGKLKDERQPTDSIHPTVRKIEQLLAEARKEAIEKKDNLIKQYRELVDDLLKKIKFE